MMPSLEEFQDLVENFEPSEDNPSPDERWKQGIPHDPRSLVIIEAINKADLESKHPIYIPTGGDGDQGEDLLYRLDMIFTYFDNQQNNK